MTLRAIFLLVGLPLIAWAQGSVLIQNVTLIDGSGSAPLENASVLVENGRIARIVQSSEMQAPSGVTAINGAGKILLPGIINLHGHVGLTKGLVQSQENYTRENGLDNLQTYADYGVTTTTSLGTDLDRIIPVRDAVKQGSLKGMARVMTALQGFTNINGYPTQAPGVKGLALEVSSPGDAMRHVDQLANKGAELVKMWVDSHHGAFKKLAPAVYKAIIDQAHKRGLHTVAHLYELEDAKQLVNAGLDMIVHSVRDVEVDAELIELLQTKGVTYVPTLTREQSTFVYADSPEWLNDPFFSVAVSPSILAGLSTTLRDTQANDPELELNRRNFRMAMLNLKKLAEAGVNIGFGTDTGPPARFPGYFEHWEAQLMADAGMTPMQIIGSFSKNASEALGIDSDFGVLAEGKVADMILLNGNPLEDIQNLSKIYQVFLAGEAIQR